MFNQHSVGMASSGMSYPTITWEGLCAWSLLMHVTLEPWEAELMVDLSARRASISSEKLKTKADE
jgi:hypothetical protein